MLSLLNNRCLEMPDAMTMPSARGKCFTLTRTRTQHTHTLTMSIMAIRIPWWDLVAKHTGRGELMFDFCVR